LTGDGCTRARHSTKCRLYTTISLYANIQGLAAPPQLSAGSFGTFLGDPEADRLLLYFFEARDERTGEYTSDTLSYFGRATLVNDPAPVPEPATVTLLRVGLSGLFWRVRRRRIQPGAIQLRLEP
jgi:hypothetical protein